VQSIGKQAVLFPGQGSQEKGMGRSLAESGKEFMEVWKIAERISGHALREIFWDGEEKDMADTRMLQPGLTAVNLTFWLKARPKLDPLCVAGHSLGEFAALFAAKALSLEDTLELVSIRGRLMSEAGDGNGAMAAILKLDEQAVETIVAQAAQQTGKELRIANYNTPQQFVISGHKDAVAVANELIKEAKGRAVPLAVSGAFHSPLMAPAAAELAKALRKADIRSPKIPVIFNVTAGDETDPEAVRSLMGRQMTSSVLWIKTIRHQYDRGSRTFVELGPKGVLTRMLKPILDGRDGFEGLSVASLEQVEAL
jgi:[acyl-carrier-protein] S-malonyltransferase